MDAKFKSWHSYADSIADIGLSNHHNHLLKRLKKYPNDIKQHKGEYLISGLLLHAIKAHEASKKCLDDLRVKGGSNG